MANPLPLLDDETNADIGRCGGFAAGVVGVLADDADGPVQIADCLSDIFLSRPSVWAGTEDVGLPDIVVGLPGISESRLRLAKDMLRRLLPITPKLSSPLPSTAPEFAVSCETPESTDGDRGRVNRPLSVDTVEGLLVGDPGDAAGCEFERSERCERECIEEWEEVSCSEKGRGATLKVSESAGDRGCGGSAIEAGIGGREAMWELTRIESMTSMSPRGSLAPLRADWGRPARTEL